MHTIEHHLLKSNLSKPFNKFQNIAKVKRDRNRKIDVFRTKCETNTKITANHLPQLSSMSNTLKRLIIQLDMW